MSNNNTNTIDRLADEVLTNDYFNSLLNKSYSLVANDFIYGKHENDLNHIEFVDLLRFSDILSNSSAPKARNHAYKVICILSDRFASDPSFKVVSNSVLSNLGNFPAIQFFKNKYNVDVALPIEFELKKQFKIVHQEVPKKEGFTFTDPQYDVFKFLKIHDSFSFSAPTSFGKSFIIISFIKHLINKKSFNNFVILVPTRALINQFSRDIIEELSELKNEHNIQVFTNSNVFEHIQSETKNQNYILVLTPERLLSYLSNKLNPRITFIFVDEAHKLAANNDVRSITLYAAIEKALGRNSDIGLYFASPNVKNPEVLLSIFRKNNGGFYKTSESPVSQNLYYFDLIKKEVKLFNNDKIIELENSILQKKISEFDLIKKLGQEQKNIIYSNSPTKAIEYAFDFCKKLAKKKHTDKIIIKFQNRIRQLVHKDYYLIDTLNYGVAFHFGQLPHSIRYELEKIFKQGYIDYIFTTSTLLEGVNLPAENIFILTDKKGNSKFKPIDFWNLSGRAGRLTKELSGNIICIRKSEKEWKSIDLFTTKGDIKLNPRISEPSNQHINNIEKILDNTPFKSTQKEEEILRYLVNKLSIDILNNHSSPTILIESLLKKNKKHLVDKINAVVKNVSIPIDILNANQSIEVLIQDKVYKRLEKLSEDSDRIKFPRIVNYDNCLLVLKAMYHYYSWNRTEKILKNKNRLAYYALLMNNWVNGYSLNQLISNTITFKSDKNKDIRIFENGKPLLIKFDKNNKAHVNQLINGLISDIEKVLRFTFEKYFNHYYQVLIEVLGEKKAGRNWAVFMEYGTQYPLVIALQNLGFSRQVAKNIFENHSDSLTEFEGKLVNVNKSMLLNRFSGNSIEYEEVVALL